MTATAITIAREALLPALALAVRVVERRNTIPILSNVLIRAGANGDGCQLTITGTDLGAEIAVTRSCAIAGMGAEVALPAANLHDIVRKLPEGSEVKLAASDESMWTVSAGRSRFRLPPIIIPRKTVELVLKMLPEKGSIRIEVSAAKVRLSMEGDAGEVTLVSKLIDGTFPDYRRVVPSGNKNRYTVAREALAGAIDRVVTVSTSKGNAVKYAFAEDDLTVTAHSPEAGSAEDQIEIAAAEGNPVEIGFNGRYCLDLLAAAGGEAVIFELGDAGTPALIRPAASDDTLFVLMPMRI